MTPRNVWVLASIRCRILHAGLLVASTLLVACGGARSTEESPGAPRVAVLITIDTLRADRVGVYNPERQLTPALDRLASEGVRFDAAVAQAPLTLPSHATILTGLRPPAHGVRTNDGFRLPPDVATLSESLREAGYRTAAFVGAYPVRRSTGLARGFEYYDDAFLDARTERPATEVVDAATGWLRQNPRERVFVWLHLFDPHTPYSAPAEHARRHPVAPYDAEVSYADEQVGRFIDALRSFGAYDDALIIVTADHGESLGEHGERTHGTFLYDATIRVPLIIRMPGLAPRVVAAPVELTDLAPTIADATGARLRLSDGITLQPLLRGRPGDEERAAYTETFYQHVLLGWSPLRAVRTSRWKFIEAPTPELYDLAQDRAETHNLAMTRTSMAAGLGSALPPFVPAGSRAGGAAASPGRTDAEERLRSLGYFAGRTATSGRTGPDPKDRIELWRHLEHAIETMEADPATAEAALRQALALEPTNGLALKYLGDLRYSAGRYAEAAARYRAAIDAGFEHPDAFLSLGAAALHLGNRDAAQRALERGLQLDPEAADAWNQLGTLHASGGRLDAARQAFQRAIDLRPSAAEPRYNLALVEKAAGRSAESMRLLEDALARRPDYPEALVERADALLAAGRPDEALTSYAAALALRPDDPQGLFGAARAAATTGRREEARRHYEHFLRVAPTTLDAHRAAARRELARLAAARRAQKR